MWIYRLTFRAVKCVLLSLISFTGAELSIILPLHAQTKQTVSLQWPPLQWPLDLHCAKQGYWRYYRTITALQIMSSDELSHTIQWYGISTVCSFCSLWPCVWELNVFIYMCDHDRVAVQDNKTGLGEQYKQSAFKCPFAASSAYGNFTPLKSN